jgi:hypothetical protein
MHIDLVAGSQVEVFQPPDFLSTSDIVWLLRTDSGRRWKGFVRRFGERAWDVAVALVRSGGIVLRCRVQELTYTPLSLRLTASWETVADDYVTELLGRPDPTSARQALLEAMSVVPELDIERAKLIDTPIVRSLRVPTASATGTTVWSVYEAAVRAACVWWPAWRSEQRLASGQLAAIAFHKSKGWTPQRQQAFANLAGMPFDRAVDQADSDVRLRGPFQWRVGEVIADAAACQPWVSLPANGLRVLGAIDCNAVGALLVENVEPFEKVCDVPEVAQRWLCIWGQGYGSHGLVSLLRSLDNLVLVAWCDLDADGIEIVADLSRRVGRTVHALGMNAQYWIDGVKLDQTTEQRRRSQQKALRLAGDGPAELRELAAAVATTGESCEQQTLYDIVLPALQNELRRFEPAPNTAALPIRFRDSQATNP